jgi:SLT domain-containing protein
MEIVGSCPPTLPAHLSSVVKSAASSDLVRAAAPAARPIAETSSHHIIDTMFAELESSEAATAHARVVTQTIDKLPYAVQAEYAAPVQAALAEQAGSRPPSCCT